MDTSRLPDGHWVRKAGFAVSSLNDAAKDFQARVRAHAAAPLYRNGYALILSSALTSGLGIVYWMVAAHLYSDSTVGLNSAVIAAMTFLSGLAQLNLKSALLRFIPVAGKATPRLVLAAYLLSVMISIDVSGIFLLGLNIWSPAITLLRSNALVNVWFLFATATWSIFVLQDAVLTGLRQAVWVPLENAFFSVAKLALLLILARSLSTYGIFASWTLPALLVLLPVNLLLFCRLIPAHIESSRTRAMPILPGQVVRYVAGDFAGSVFIQLPDLLLPMLIISQAGPQANAYYYLAGIIALSIQLVIMNMTTSLTVEGARDETRLQADSRHLMRHLLRLLGPVILIFCVGAAPILRLFGRSYAQEGAPLLRLLVIATIPYSLNALFLCLARIRRRMRGIVAVQASLSALILGLSYILLPQFGITGVGIAWLAAQTLVAIPVMLTQLRPVLFPAKPTLSGETK